MKYYLAIDIGASSGRHIAGWIENGELKTREVFRFPNGVCEKDGHLTWNTASLVSHVKKGIEKAKEEFGDIVSLSIDTWGVDYSLVKGGKPVSPCYAYRDSRTAEAIEKVRGIIPFKELYSRTGTQFQPFNTLYQLYADKLAGRLDGADGLLMMPEYLMYELCGTYSREFTNATTTGLVNAKTGEYDDYIIKKLGLPEKLFPKLDRPGKVIGEYSGIKVVLCATHDTGSAVEGIPVKADAPYISSGTWSLLGVRTERPLTDENSMAGNWSNEGGPFYNRYQKNIMGMWLINRLRDELCPERSFKEIEKDAELSDFSGYVDCDDRAFLSPKSMKKAFDNALGGIKLKNEDYFRCAYNSLARSYKKAIEELERNTGRTYGEICIVGGGAKNVFLNGLTEKLTGKKVIAIPIEATAIGNLKIQTEADK